MAATTRVPFSGARTPWRHPATRRTTLGLSAAADPRFPLQIWVSTANDPYLNLAAEQHLLETSHPRSALLFLYANTPCVVLGRSQNPWVEADLARLRSGLPSPLSSSSSSPSRPEASASTAPSLDRARHPVTLVRRRSGGGAVFHDLGNVNYSVIFPTDAFDRDMHAEMVARALGRLGVEGVRVNARHDIVMDAAAHAHAADGAADPPPPPPPTPVPFKISGSAYRVTRLRSMHHGTCLLASPHLDQIGPLLRSPAQPFISSRGVESVRSPVRNVFGEGHDVGPAEFIKVVQREFYDLWRGRIAASPKGGSETAAAAEAPEPLFGVVDWDVLKVPEVEKIFQLLQTPKWIYGQTPQFTFSTHPTDADPRERPPLPIHLPPDFRATITARHGQITQATILGLDYADSPSPEKSVDRDATVSRALLGRDLYDILDWPTTLADAAPSLHLRSRAVGLWLNSIFNTHTPKDQPQ